MRILILNADYPNFLDRLYRSKPELVDDGYTSQMNARNATLFGCADFYSSAFNAIGHQAIEIHVNNFFLQRAWGIEHGMPFAMPQESSRSSTRFPSWLTNSIAPIKPMLRPIARRMGLSPRLSAPLESVLMAQVEEFRPDVILNQDVFYVDTALMKRIKTIGRPILIGQVGIEPSYGEDWTTYDLMISQLPRIVNSFRKLGVTAEVCHLAFESSLLDRLPDGPTVDIDISFVGTVSSDHRQRIALLEAVAERFDLQLWGNLSQTLSSSSPLRKCYQGEVWGIDMYQILRRSRITLNSHIDIAGNEAGNQRLFEATGVGTFLLTDFKENLGTLFNTKTEIATWRTVDDCLKAIEFYLGNTELRKEIAISGQKRTLSTHTYSQRINQIIGFIETIIGSRANDARSYTELASTR